MSVRRPSPSGEAPPLLALSQPSRRLDEVLRAGQVHREASVASLLDKRARVQDSHTALENAQRHAREQQENVQRLNGQLLVAQEREQATREEAEFDKRELERARGSLRLRLQKLQKQLADRNALNSTQVEELARDLARAQSELAQRDLAIADYSAQVDKANEAQTALQKELDDLRRVIENVPRGIEAEVREWIREATDVLNATAPLQNSVDELTKENSKLKSRFDELRRTQSRDRDVCEGLHAQIDGLRKTFSAELARAMASGQPKAATQSSKQMCNNANSNPDQYDTDLYMAIATGRAEDALELIQNGARLDKGNVFTFRSFYGRRDVYNAACIVLFEDMTWLGTQMNDFGPRKANLLDGFIHQQGNIKPHQPPADFLRSYLGELSESHLYSRRLTEGARYMQADLRDREGVLQIIDALGKNPCSGSGFQLVIPAEADPTNWTPALVRRAYEKGIMPRADDWSLLNAVLLWLGNSPLEYLYTVESRNGNKPEQEQRRHPIIQLAAMSGEELIAYEQSLIKKIRAMWDLATELGQVRIERGARNTPFLTFELRRKGWRPTTAFSDPSKYMPTTGKPYLRLTLAGGEKIYRNVANKFQSLDKQALAVLQQRYALAEEMEKALGL